MGASSSIGGASRGERRSTERHGACWALADVTRRTPRCCFTRSLGRRVAAVLLAVVSACATPAQRGRDSTSAGGPPDDTARIARLEREARALASPGGCEAASSCRTAPVGSRGCGGPRDYLVYCPASTDTAALQRTLDELARVESAYNEREGVVSTCQLRLPPAVSVSGGRCVATR
jgi:hypothetical protein